MVVIMEKTGSGSAQVHDVDDTVHEVGHQQLVAQEAAFFQDDLDHLRAFQSRQEDHGVGQGAQGRLGAFEGQLPGFTVDQAQSRVFGEDGGDVAGGTCHGRGDERAADAAAGILDHEACAQVVEAVDDERRAFLDADALAKWLPPNGFTARVHAMDVRVGGSFRMSFTNFATGQSHSFGGEYLELVPNERIRHTDKFDDPNLPGDMQTTVTVQQVSCGAQLDVVQEGIPEVIPLEMCYLGWQESLAQLATLVEPEIPS